MFIILERTEMFRSDSVMLYVFTVCVGNIASENLYVPLPKNKRDYHWYTKTSLPGSDPKTVPQRCSLFGTFVDKYGTVYLKKVYQQIINR